MTQEVLKVHNAGIKPIILRRQIAIIQTRLISRQAELEQMTGEVKQCEIQIKTLAPEVDQAAQEAEALKNEASNKSGIKEAPPDVVNGDITEKDLEKDINQANIQVWYLWLEC